MRVHRAKMVGQCKFPRSDIILHVFGIECRKPNLISYWYLDFITILVSQVRKKFHAKFSWCCHKRSVSSLLSIIFICITEQRWAIHLLPTGWSLCPYIGTNHGIFMQIFQWQTSFCLAIAPTKPGPNTIGFFPVGAFNK